MKSPPKLKACKLPGKAMVSRNLIHITSETQGLQTTRQGSVLQPLIEIASEAQRLQTAGQNYILQLAIETASETQKLQTARQAYVYQTLMDIVSEAQHWRASRKNPMKLLLQSELCEHLDKELLHGDHAVYCRLDKQTPSGNT